MIDPTELQTVSKEKLLQEYEKLGYKEEEIASTKMAIRQEILARMKLDAEVWGYYSVTKVKRPNYNSVKIETAKELGAIKEAVDTKVLANLHAKGVKIEGLKETIYPLIKNLEVEDK